MSLSSLLTSARPGVAVALLVLAALCAARSLQLHCRGCQIHSFEFAAYLLFCTALIVSAR